MGLALSWSKDPPGALEFLPVRAMSLTLACFSSVSSAPLCIQPWTDRGEGWEAWGALAGSVPLQGPTWTLLVLLQSFWGDGSPQHLHAFLSTCSSEFLLVSHRHWPMGLVLTPCVSLHLKQNLQNSGPSQILSGHQHRAVAR